ncbi:hypothetical protein HK102_012295 [Quaeritorhiza haematococci]|nr:hypothetical protein HK102_012295 [Quaeritorhiza haematococci]
MTRYGETESNPFEASFNTATQSTTTTDALIPPSIPTNLPDPPITLPPLTAATNLNQQIPPPPPSSSSQQPDDQLSNYSSAASSPMSSPQQMPLVGATHVRRLSNSALNPNTGLNSTLWAPSSPSTTSSIDPSENASTVAAAQSEQKQEPQEQPGQSEASSSKATAPKKGRPSSSTSTRGTKRKAGGGKDADTEEDMDDKRRKFLERNRLAASKCRQKKKQWVEELQRQSTEISAKNRQLQLLVSQLKEEVIVLKNQLLLHRNCQCNVIQAYTASQFASSSSGAPTPSKGFS